MDPITIIFIVLAVVVLWFVFVYNRFIRLRNRSEEAWADIDVQLKRRYNLIPNLIETVKGYASHEMGVFEKVTEARTRALNAESGGNVKKMEKAENMLSGALKTLFAVSENYPDLKANANFLDLQRELADAENKIQAARRFYNTNVMALNTRVESFPYNLIANTFKFSKREFFEIEEGEKEVPKVKF